MVAALAPLQVGIGVPGGAAVASAVAEAILRADTEKHMLNIDIRNICLLYTSPSPRDGLLSRMPSSA